MTTAILSHFSNHSHCDVCLPVSYSVRVTWTAPSFSARLGLKQRPACPVPSSSSSRTGLPTADRIWEDLGKGCLDRQGVYSVCSSFVKVVAATIHLLLS